MQLLCLMKWLSFYLVMALLLSIVTLCSDHILLQVESLHILMMATLHMLLYTMCYSFPMGLMAGTAISFTVYLLVQIMPLIGNLHVFLKLNILHFACIPMKESIQLFIRVVIYFSSTSLTCGLQQIRLTYH